MLLTRTQVSNDQPGMGTTNVLQPLCNVAPLLRTTLTGSHVSARHFREVKLIAWGSELSQVQAIHFGMLFFFLSLIQGTLFKDLPCARYDAPS